ncbi:MAG: hypothetical protein R2798_01515 [Chitinophagales bacterium]|nr:hypothetical protein [Bacteroidota bacterium]MCB9042882.1 hypothetical protein [Chitinophagales bacterium]
MPDKSFYENDAYVNDAWQSMRELLDKEMPEKKAKKVGAFLWWFALPLVMGAGILAYTFWHNSNFQQTDLQPNTQIFTPQEQATTVSSRNTNLNNTPSENTTFSENASLQSGDAATASFSSTKTTFSQNNQTKTSNIFTPEIAAAAPNTFTNNTLQSSKQVAISDMFEKVAAENNAPTLVMSKAVTKTFSPIETLPRQGFEVEKKSLSLLEITAAASKKSRAQTQFLQAGFQANLAGAQGFYAGYLFQKNISTRWRIETGLQLSFNQSKRKNYIKDYNLWSDTNNSFQSNSESSFDGTANSSDPNDFSVNVDAYQQITAHFPLQIVYAPKTRWQFGAGVYNDFNVFPHVGYEFGSGFAAVTFDYGNAMAFHLQQFGAKALVRFALRPRILVEASYLSAFRPLVRENFRLENKKYHTHWLKVGINFKL